MNKKYSAYNLGVLQGKAYRVMQNHLSEALSSYNVSIPEWKLLGQLFDNNEMKAADIATNLEIDPPLVTVLVKSLEQKGFLKRKQNKADKRASVIYPTYKTKVLIPELEQVVTKEMKHILKGISTIEMMIYIRILQTIVKQGTAYMVKKNYLIE